MSTLDCDILKTAEEIVQFNSPEDTKLNRDVDAETNAPVDMSLVTTAGALFVQNIIALAGRPLTVREIADVAVVSASADKAAAVHKLIQAILDLELSKEDTLFIKVGGEHYDINPSKRSSITFSLSEFEKTRAVWLANLWNMKSPQSPDSNKGNKPMCRARCARKYCSRKCMRDSEYCSVECGVSEALSRIRVGGAKPSPSSSPLPQSSTLKSKQSVESSPEPADVEPPAKKRAASPINPINANSNGSSNPNNGGRPYFARRISQAPPSLFPSWIISREVISAFSSCTSVLSTQPLQVTDEDVFQFENGKCNNAVASCFENWRSDGRFLDALKHIYNRVVAYRDIVIEKDSIVSELQQLKDKLNAAVVGLADPTQSPLFNEYMQQWKGSSEMMIKRCADLDAEVIYANNFIRWLSAHHDKCVSLMLKFCTILVARGPLDSQFKWINEWGVPDMVESLPMSSVPTTTTNSACSSSYTSPVNSPLSSSSKGDRTLPPLPPLNSSAAGILKRKHEDIDARVSEPAGPNKDEIRKMKFLLLVVQKQWLDCIPSIYNSLTGSDSQACMFASFSSEKFAKFYQSDLNADLPEDVCQIMKYFITNQDFCSCDFESINYSLVPENLFPQFRFVHFILGIAQYTASKSEKFNECMKNFLEFLSNAELNFCTTACGDDGCEKHAGWRSNCMSNLKAAVKSLQH